MRIICFLIIALFHGHTFQAPYFFLEIKADDQEQRSKIAKTAHIDKVYEDRVFTVVNESDFLNIKKLFKDFILSVDLISDYEGLGIPQPFNYEFPPGDENYHTFDEVKALFLALENQYPKNAQVFHYGQSIEQRDLFGLKISSESIQNQNEKPAFLIMATHHAREHLSTEMPVLFADKFLSDLLTDDNIKNLLEDVDIYIIPFINPDGALYDIKNSQYHMWRKNRKLNAGGSFGVDLNRNYSYGFGTGGSSKNPYSDVYMGTGPFSEPETKALRDFVYAHKNITMALSFHSFSELILYPWGGKYEGVGGNDEKIFKQIAQDISLMNHYTPMQSSELYIASGDTCDFLYGELQIFCFTFELSPSSMQEGGFYPGQNMIEKAFDDNYEPMLYMAQKAKNPRGF